MEIKSIYVNGDSFAWGAELDDNINERFSKLVSNHFSIEEINESECGIANGDIFYRTKEYIKNNKDDISNTFFIILLTDFSRTEGDIKFSEYKQVTKTKSLVTPDVHSQPTTPTIAVGGVGDITLPTLEPVEPIEPLDRKENINVEQWNNLPDDDKKLLRFGEELMLLQNIFIENKLNYIFIDGFSSYGSILNYRKLLRLNYWKQKHYKKYFGDDINISFKGFDKVTLKEFKNIMSMVDNILYPNDELTIFDLQITIDDIMKDGHPGKRTHKIISENIIDRIENLYGNK